MKKSNLAFFENLVFGHGVSLIHTDFLKLLDDNLRDSRKKYDPKEEIIYLFREKVDGITEESFPFTFKRFLKNKIESECNYYLSWLNETVEIRDQPDVTRIVSDHSKRIKKLSIDAINNTPTKYAISKIKERLSELGASFHIEKLIEQFSLEYSSRPKVKYKPVSIATYLKAWYKHRGEPEFRAKAKREISPEIDLPADNGLITWEKKLQDFLKHAQE